VVFFLGVGGGEGGGFFFFFFFSFTDDDKRRRTWALQNRRRRRRIFLSSPPLFFFFFPPFVLRKLYVASTLEPSPFFSFGCGLHCPWSTIDLLCVLPPPPLPSLFSTKMTVKKSEHIPSAVPFLFFQNLPRGHYPKSSLSLFSFLLSAPLSEKATRQKTDGRRRLLTPN